MSGRTLTEQLGLGQDWRTVFLICVGMSLMRVSLWRTLLVLIGFTVCNFLDERARGKARDQALEGEIYSWETDTADSLKEAKGNFSRTRLPDNQQAIVTRLAELLRRMP